MSAKKKAKVLAQGVPMGLSVNARELISANKGRLMGPSMQSLLPLVDFLGKVEVTLGTQVEVILPFIGATSAHKAPTA
jgi:hypothetical protein